LLVDGRYGPVIFMTLEPFLFGQVALFSAPDFAILGRD
jgi:hypothetical protein